MQQSNTLNSQSLHCIALDSIRYRAPKMIDRVRIMWRCGGADKVRTSTSMELRSLGIGGLNGI